MNTARIELAYGRGYKDRMGLDALYTYRGMDYQSSAERRAYDTGWDHARDDLVASYQQATMGSAEVAAELQG